MYIIYMIGDEDGYDDDDDGDDVMIMSRPNTMGRDQCLFWTPTYKPAKYNQLKLRQY